MARPTRIYKGKQPYRLHYIPEWAERRNVSQADIVREIGADKSNVSRWFKGGLPSDQYLIALTEFFNLDEPASLFRHPDDDWITRLLRGQSAARRKALREFIERGIALGEVA